jgi:hypothetical protein
MKLDVYSYRSTHRHVCCSSGALCRGYGAEMCNTQLPNILKTSCALHRRLRSVLLSSCKLVIT